MTKRCGFRNDVIFRARKEKRRVSWVEWSFSMHTISLQKIARESLIHKKRCANYTHRREASARLMIRLDNAFSSLCMHALLQFINSSLPFSRNETISTDRVINPTRCPSLHQAEPVLVIMYAVYVSILGKNVWFPSLIAAHSRKHVTSSGWLLARFVDERINSDYCTFYRLTESTANCAKNKFHYELTSVNWLIVDVHNRTKNVRL